LIVLDIWRLFFVSNIATGSISAYNFIKYFFKEKIHWIVIPGHQTAVFCISVGF